MIDDHLIEPEPRRLGLSALVLQGLVGGAHSAIENGLHRWRFLSPGVLSVSGIVPNGKSNPCGRSFGAVLDDPWTMPLRTSPPTDLPHPTEIFLCYGNHAIIW